jgi:hypothetical protein
MEGNNPDHIMLNGIDEENPGFDPFENDLAIDLALVCWRVGGGGFRPSFCCSFFLHRSPLLV